MGAALGDVLPLALGIAASPFPIIPVILLLFTPRAQATSRSFLAVWLVGIVLATGLFVVLADALVVADAPRTWASWARTGLGAALVLLGLRQWRDRRAVKDAPGWIQSIAQATPAKGPPGWRSCSRSATRRSCCWPPGADSRSAQLRCPRPLRALS